MDWDCAGTVGGGRGPEVSLAVELVEVARFGGGRGCMVADVSLCGDAIVNSGRETVDRGVCCNELWLLR